MPSFTVNPSPEKPPDPAMQALKEAAGAKLRAICEQPLSVSMLTELAQLARLVKTMLMVTEGPKGMRRGFGGYGSLGAIGYDAGMPGQYGDDDGSVISPVGMAGNGAETFGAKMVREIVSATKETNSSKEIGNLVEALRNAVEGKLGDEIIVPLRSEVIRSVGKLALQVPDDEPNGVMRPVDADEETPVVGWSPEYSGPPPGGGA